MKVFAPLPSRPAHRHRTPFRGRSARPCETNRSLKFRGETRYGFLFVADARLSGAIRKCIQHYKFYRAQLAVGRRNSASTEKGVASPQKAVERKEVAIAGRRSTKLALYLY